MEQALGQYMLYRGLLRRQEPDRTLYLAVPRRIYETVFASVIGQVVLDDYGVKLIVCDMEHEVVAQWHP